MKDVWLSKLKPDEVGQPYIDVRAHRAFWESVERIAQRTKAQLNDTLLGGDLSAAREITKTSLAGIEETKMFFVKEYNFQRESDENSSG